MPPCLRRFALLACASLSLTAHAQQAPTACDIDADQDIDRDDIALIMAARNQPASGPDDPRDPDRSLTITVNDARICTQSCTLAQCAPPPSNRAPTADAGADQAVFAGSLVTLNGAASSDPDGDALAFHWTLRVRPPGSTAELSDANAVAPTFVADADGQYEIDLIVNDGRIDSAVDTVIVVTTPLNTAPVANAGADQFVVVGERVTLDASQSTDVDGDALAYAWTLVGAPAGSAAALADADAVQSTFSPDLAGTYSIELQVIDGRGGVAVDAVQVFTTPANRAPIASAGPDQSVVVNSLVSLDGSASSDPDGDALTYRWSFVARPAGSAAVLAGANTATAAFIADEPGDYAVQLIVNDGRLDSDPDAVLISSINTPPVADAGPDQTVPLGARVQLDGGGSHDADGDALAYSWSLLSQPASSGATIPDPFIPTPEFDADAAGVYVVQLVVNDGVVDSAPDTARITVEAPDAVVTAVATDDVATELGADPARFTITRSGDASAALTVNYLMAGVATNGVDYEALPGSVVIPAGAASVAITLTPIADADIEGAEGAILSLQPGDGYAVGFPALALATITDSIVVNITAADSLASEATLDPAVFVITRSGDDLADPLIVSLAASGAANNPLFPDDTNLISSLATIPAGESSVTITVTPVRDNAVEGDEDLTLTVNPTPGYVAGASPSATIMIADDPPIVAIQATSASAAEAGLTPGAFTFTRSGGNLAAALTARCAFSGTAANSGDYVFTGCSATIPANQTTGVLTITPRADNVVEGSETVIATLTTSTTYVIGSPSSATITIADDPAIVTVTATDATASEAGLDPGVFTFERTGGNLAAPLTIFVARGGTATNTVDYSGVSVLFSIPANQASTTVTVAPADDAQVEGPETVTLTINPSSSFIIAGPGAATVTILDDD